VRNLAKVNGTTGVNNAAFTLHPSGRVAHMEIVRDSAGVLHLLVGGYAKPYLRSVNEVTGLNQAGYLPPGAATDAFISGTYQFDGASAQTPRIYNMTVYPAPYQPGSTTVNPAVLMTGIFTNVGPSTPTQTNHHEQIFRLNLTSPQATVSPWSPAELYQHCLGRQPFYAQDAAWGPNMSAIYVVTTGYRLASELALPRTQRPQHRTGPCDAVIAYPATEQEIPSTTANPGHTWINYTGCDSLYSVATDNQTVFIGGHQRFINNGEACDQLGTGGRAQEGLGEIDPATGQAQTGPVRGRGLGAADMLWTSTPGTTGLWVASDNQANTDSCGLTTGGTTQHGRMGICFLPAAP
jgi:hypothetical protein